MLTDKTKEAFTEFYILKFINNNLTIGLMDILKIKDNSTESIKTLINHFYSLPFSMQYGIYIDFFDENGIYIDAHRTIKGYSVMIQHGKEMEFIELDKDYKTRIEARKNALLKANILFNENNY